MASAAPSPLPALYKRPTTKFTIFAGDMAVYLKVGSSYDRDTIQADLDTLQECQRVPTLSLK